MAVRTQTAFYLERILFECSDFEKKERKDWDIQLLSTSLYLSFNRSILSGEYYLENAQNLIKKISDKIISLQSINALPKDFTAEDLFKYKLGEANKQLLKLFDYSIQYGELIKDISDNLQSINDDNLAQIKDTWKLQEYKSQLAKSTPEKDVVRNLVFKVNMYLVYLDEYLECSQSTVYDLQTIVTYIKSIGESQLLPVDIMRPISDKAEFLVYKINFRYYKNKESILECPTLNPENIFFPFSQRLIKHYTETPNYTEIEKLEKTLQLNSDITPLLPEIKSFHLLNKYYKRKENIENPNERLIKLSNLQNNVETLLSEKPGLYNHFSYKSICNLISNSKLEVEWEIEEANKFSSIISDLRKFIENKSTSCQSTFITEKYNQLLIKKGISDYFAFKIFIKYLDKIINFIREDSNEILIEKKVEINDDNYKRIKLKFNEIIDYLLRVYRDCNLLVKKRYIKMQSYEYKPVYLTYAECSIPHKWVDRDGIIFLDSSYILPNDFERVRKQIDLSDAFINSKLRAVRNKVEMDLTMGLITEKNESFIKKVKENEFKVVQIVALFVSIATFVLANIKIFEGKNGMQSFGLVIGLAACFILFNSALNWFIQWQLYKEIWAWKSVISGVLYMTIFATLAFCSYSILAKEGSKVKEIDSINTKLMTDSSIIHKLDSTQKATADTILKLKETIAKKK